MDLHRETGESNLFKAPYLGKGSKAVESSPILDGNSLPFGANDGYIYTIDSKTGTEIKRILPAPLFWEG